MILLRLERYLHEPSKVGYLLRRNVVLADCNG